MTTHPPAARLARRSDPNPKGTSYYVDPEHSRFMSRQPWPEYESLEHTREDERAARAAENRKALTRIALEVLCEPRLSDPNIRCAREVLNSILDPLMDNGSLSLQDYDDAIAAFNEGVENAAEAVARAWLKERRSLPIDTAVS